MLVYRDFAAQGDDRVYRAGPVLELAAYSRSTTSRLRQVALPHLERLVAVVGESANLAIRTGDTTRFVASVECDQTLRVGTREGMVFPAERTTAGVLLLAALTDEELAGLFDGDRLAIVRRAVGRVRRNGFAVNQQRSERGVVAVGVAVRAPDGEPMAGLSVSMPSVRYDKNRLPSLVSTLRRAAEGIDRDLRGQPRPGRP